MPIKGCCEAVKNSLSIPSKPDASTKPLAERPKLSRVAALDATVGKFRLPAPPPMESMTCRCSCSAFRRISEPIHPVAPSTSL